MRRGKASGNLGRDDRRQARPLKGPDWSNVAANDRSTSPASSSTLRSRSASSKMRCACASGTDCAARAGVTRTGVTGAGLTTGVRAPGTGGKARAGAAGRGAAAGRGGAGASGTDRAAWAGLTRAGVTGAGLPTGVRVTGAGAVAWVGVCGPATVGGRAGAAEAGRTGAGGAGAARADTDRAALMVDRRADPKAGEGTASPTPVATLVATPAALLRRLRSASLEILTPPPAARTRGPTNARVSMPVASFRRSFATDSASSRRAWSAVLMTRGVVAGVNIVGATTLPAPL